MVTKRNISVIKYIIVQNRINVERRSYDYPSLKYVSQFNVSTTQLLPGRLRLLGCYN